MELKQIKSLALKSYTKNGSRLGLPKDFIGSRFNVDGIDYTVIGLSTRIRLRPIIAETADGKVHSFPLSFAPTTITPVVI